MSFASEFSHSFPYLLRGFSIIRQPKIRRYIIGPIIVNILVIVALLWLIGWQLDYWLTLGFDHLPHWLSWARWLIWTLALVVAFIAFCYFFSFFALIIASPFNGLLAVEVEQYLTGQAPESGFSFWHELWFGIVDGVRVFWYGLWRTIVLAVLSVILFIIPGGGLFIPVLWFLLGAYILAFGYMDIALANHGLIFSQRRRYAQTHLGSYLGLGTSITLATAIPLINLIVMPSAVAASTALFVDQKKSAMLAKQS